MYRLTCQWPIDNGSQNSWAYIFFRSPNYPSYYPPNSDCTNRIESATTGVTFQITAFYTENNYDKVVFTHSNTDYTFDGDYTVYSLTQKYQLITFLECQWTTSWRPILVQRFLRRCQVHFWLRYPKIWFQLCSSRWLRVSKRCQRSRLHFAHQRRGSSRKRKDWINLFLTINRKPEF